MNYSNTMREQIVKMEPLTEEEKRIVAENTRLIGWFVKKWRAKVTTNKSDPDDLFQVATLGLMRAVKTWDPSRGSLSTHAGRWVNNLMTNYGIEDAVVAPPATTWLKQRQLKKRLERGESLDCEAIRKAMKGHSVEGLHEFAKRQLFATILTVDAESNDEGESNYRQGYALLKELPDESPLPDELVITKKDIDKLDAAIDSLKIYHRNKVLPPDIAKRVIIGYYIEGRTLEAMSREYGASKQRLDQIKTAALKKLRGFLKCARHY